jgi:hypothetical protein
MSQSSKLIKSFGALSVAGKVDAVLGSTSSTFSTFSPTHTVLADADATLTVSNLKSGIVTITPTVSRVVTLPTAELVKAWLSKSGLTVDIVVINKGAETFSVTLAAGTGCTIHGSAVVRDSDPTTQSATGSATFRIRQNSVGSTPTYDVYRI